MKVELTKPKTVYGIEMKAGEELEVRDEIGKKWISAKEAKEVGKAKSKKKK